LCRYVDQSKAKTYFAAAQTMLKTLSAPPYLAAPNTNGGFILQHSVGHIPQGTEVDVPLTYADYYYIEGLTRYKNFGR
jgi:hypothetical protein